MVSIPGLGTPMQAAEFLLDAGLAIVPWDEEHLRISYANSYENLSIAMDRMEKALRRTLLILPPPPKAGLPASQRPGGSSFPPLTETESPATGIFSDRRAFCF